MKKIAVTGCLSCGKSTVCGFLQEWGAFVVDADAIVHQLLSLETRLGRQVVRLLGSSVVHQEVPGVPGTQGTIDRQKIADRVFTEPELLRKLERLIHPAVMEEINKIYTNASQTSTAPLFVAEVPLLFEAGLESEFDVVITVSTQQELAQKRSRFSPEEFSRREKRQESLQSKASRSHFTLLNNTSLAHLRAETHLLFHKLQES